jgi:hypothetical protein
MDTSERRSRNQFQHATEGTGGRRPVVTDEHFIALLRETADRLLADGASRGDLKMLSTALRELRHALKVMTPYRHTRKVTVFGSARLPADDPAYVAAVDFGKAMAEADFMVITGGAAGIMEAGHVGSGREKAIGMNILLPFEQRVNPVIDGDRKSMHLKYFFTRKLMLVKESDAVALFPGGFGTQDEGFEVLTLVQTGKSHLFPIVMLDAPGGDYWTRWQEYIEGVLLARQLISPEDLSLYKIAHTVEEAVAEILGFYRVYHSMRYVGAELVLRLKHMLSESSLEQIRTGFADILVSGTFCQTAACDLEEGAFPELARLRFAFNRRNHGRLRQLINFINQGDADS